MRSGAIYCWLLRFMCYSDSTKAESPQVINVIVPNQRHHFLLPLGYILTSFLLLVFIILIIVLITHRHKSKGLEKLLYQKYLTNIQIYVNTVRTFVLSVFYPQPSTRWATSHKHTHTSAPLKHALRRVFFLLRQVWEKSLQLRAFWDGFCWGDRVQPGGQKHRWGTSPPEREGQVCPHCGFKFTVRGVFPDYKNNLLKEKAHLSSPPKVIDLDKGNSYLSACLHMEQTIKLI